MATKMENVITVLVLIAIITSAGSLWYGLTVAGDVSTLTGSVADLAGSVSELTTSVADVATSVGDVATSVASLTTATAADLADITGDLSDITGDLATITGNLTDIADRVTAVEETLLPARTLTVFSLWSDAEEANFLVALERFENKTGIPVRHVGYDTLELLITIPTQLKAGVAIADVVIAPWPSWILSLAGEGYLRSVTEMIDTTKFPEPALDVVTAQDEIWGVPFKVSGKPGFWYRKSFFTNNSLTVPTTFDEFNNTLLPAIKAIAGVQAPIASGNGVGWPLSDTTEAFIVGLGGAQLQLDLIFGDTQFNSTVVKDVFVQLAAMLGAGYFSVPDDFDAQVARVWDGTYGIYFQGSFITAFEPFASNLDDVGFFPFPGTDGATGAVDYAIMPALTAHPVEAQQLIEFLASAEAQEIMVGLGGFLAAHSDVPDSAYSPIDLSVLQFLRTVTVVPDLDDAIGGDFQTTFWDQLKALWVSPTMDLDTLLQTLQDSWSAPPF